MSMPIVNLFRIRCSFCGTESDETYRDFDEHGREDAKQSSINKGWSFVEVMMPALKSGLSLEYGHYELCPKCTRERLPAFIKVE